MHVSVTFCQLLLVVGVVLASDNDRSQLPKPSPVIVQWQRQELQLFHHFGVNTFTDREWGLGNEDPNIFQPTKLNTTQWVQAAKDAGFTQSILVSKHHDGFFLYPNPYTNHSVASSSWRNGKGDVVSDFVKSCALVGVQPAFYLSPWDRNYYNMTWKPSYNDFYANTLEVLVTKYGQFFQLWWDGANAVPGRESLYDWHRFLKILRQNQPSAIAGGCGGENGAFDCGPDTAWIRNEGGWAAEKVWSSHAPSVEFNESASEVYAPYFCDFSIRPGWFYHQSEDDKLRSLDDLKERYFLTVGQNCVMQLNIPPNKEGLLCDKDVERLQELGNWIKTQFSDQKDYIRILAKSISASSANNDVNHISESDLDTFWQPSDDDNDRSVRVFFSGDVQVNTILLQEYIPGGQAVESFDLKCMTDDNNWEHVANGTTIGHKKLVRFDETECSAIQISITATRYDYSPQIARIGAYYIE